MSGTTQIVVEYKTLQQVLVRGKQLEGMTFRDILDLGIVPEGVEHELSGVKISDTAQLPGPTFHVSPRTIVCIDIGREAIERSKRLTYSQAAEELGISKARVCQLVKSHRPDAKSFDGKSYVTIASVNKRKANPPASHRSRRETPALGV